MAERLRLIEQVKKGIEIGLGEAKKMLAQVEAQEQIISREDRGSRKDRYLAKKESMGDMRIDSVLNTLNKAGDLRGHRRWLELKKDAQDKIDQARNLDNRLVQLEKEFAQLAQQEKQKVEDAKRDVQALVSDWENAKKLAGTLPTEIQGNQFVMTDKEAYAKLQQLFTEIPSKLQQAQTYTFEAEQLEQGSLKVDEQLKAVLQALNQIDVRERQELFRQVRLMIEEEQHKIVRDIKGHRVGRVIKYK